MAQAWSIKHSHTHKYVGMHNDDKKILGIPSYWMDVDS